MYSTGVISVKVFIAVCILFLENITCRRCSNSSKQHWPLLSFYQSFAAYTFTVYPRGDIQAQSADFITAVDYKCSKHLNLASKFSRTCPLWSICQFASTGRRAPWGWLLVISLCLTGLSLDQRETNVFRSASTSPQPCHRRSLVKRCFSANVTPIAFFMSTSGLSHGLAVYRDPPADARGTNQRKKSWTKYLISPQPQTFHQKFKRTQMSETRAPSLFVLCAV